MEPIQEFESIEQAYEYLEEWQDTLYLNDWIIKVKLVEPTEIQNKAGYIDFCMEKQSAVIYIAKLNEDLKNRITKIYNEVTLVHELLHLKMNYVENEDSYEGKMLEIHEHQLLDQLSKGLIMAKYNLEQNWFKNFAE